MSVVFRCDGCGKQALGSFDGAQWTRPRGWLSRALDDWEIHAHEQACLDKTLDKHRMTPTDGYRVGSESSDELVIPLSARPFFEAPPKP